MVPPDSSSSCKVRMRRNLSVGQVMAKEVRCLGFLRIEDTPARSRSAAGRVVSFCRHGPLLRIGKARPWREAAISFDDEGEEA